MAGYTIAYAVLLVTGARLGDILGHRRMFLAGLVLFTLASLGCGLATTAGFLIALRFVQGAGAAVMIPQVLSLIQRTHAGPARARAMTRYSAVLAGGAVVGQLVGGLLISANLFGSGWRPGFLVNVPIGVALLIAGARTLPHGKGEPGRTLDLAGAGPADPGRARVRASARAGPARALAAVGLGPDGRQRPLGRRVRPGRAAGGRDRRHAADPRPGAAGAGGAGRDRRPVHRHDHLQRVFFPLALHLQDGLGYSPRRAGLTSPPAAAAFALVSLNWRRAPASWYGALIVGGFVAFGAAMAGLAEVLHEGGSGGAALYLIGALSSAGMAAAFGPLMTRVLLRVPVELAADATGVVVTVNQLGLLVGVATFGTLYLDLAGGLRRTRPSGRSATCPPTPKR